MSDTITIAPLSVTAPDLTCGDHALLAGDTTLTRLPPASRYSLRTRDLVLLSQVLGRLLPTRISETLDGVACLGPDEYLADLPAGTELPLGEGLPLSVVDISSRAVAFQLSGPHATYVLSAGCPLDLDTFAVGRATRTLFETVEVVLWRDSPDTWRVLVWRSFAAWLWNSLLAAG